MMQIKQEVLERTFEHLRQCGRGRAECVVYLTGTVDTHTVVDDVVHPMHTASAAGYDLDSSAIAELWRSLTTSRRSIRIQVHTHPGAAYHSSRDDSLALVHTPGFLSLVIPNFAFGDTGFDRAFLAELDQQGRWHGVPINNRLEITP